jgi:hypothetical protein
LCSIVEGNNRAEHGMASELTLSCLDSVMIWYEIIRYGMCKYSYKSLSYNMRCYMAISLSPSDLIDDPRVMSDAPSSKVRVHTDLDRFDFFGLSSGFSDFSDFGLLDLDLEEVVGRTYRVAIK